MRIKKILLCIICMLFIGTVSANTIEKNITDNCSEEGKVCFQYPTQVKAGEEFEVTIAVKEVVDLKFVQIVNFRTEGVEDPYSMISILSGFGASERNNDIFCNASIGRCFEVINNSGISGATVPVLKIKFKAVSTLTSNDEIKIQMDNVFIASNVEGTNTEITSTSGGYNLAIKAVGTTSTPKCKYHDGKYYDKNGNVVTKEVYETDCGITTPKCKLENGKYYDKNGNVVTKEVYEADCGIATPKCKLENGKYYDKNGNVVTKEVYEADCGITTPKCKLENGKYYDNNGNVVTKEAYDEACGNPDTGINTTFVIVIAGVLFVIGCSAFFKKSKRYY